MTQADSVTTESVAGSLFDGLVAQAVKHPQSPAILAPGRSPLTFGLLRSQIEASFRSLRSAGIRRNDRVALVLPNGPELMAAFLAVGSCATSVPLNPAYRAAEFKTYLQDLKVAALIVEKGTASPCREVARAQGTPIIELSRQDEKPAGSFRLASRESSSEITESFALPDDVALVLQTSGTTSQPKLVPLTHRNLLASARNNQATLQLCESDRYLNIMPLFHLHSLLLTVSSLLSGGGVIAAPTFEPAGFFHWLEELKPTWYSGAPALHQAILTAAPSQRSLIARNPLRFVRSSAAPLPVRVMTDLETVFRAPVIEAYGMTETPFPVTSNPLPPGKRKPGSVGIAAGSQVDITDENGNRMPQGARGEVVIRGDNVMHGYQDNSAANQAAFRDGWFRSGDQGYFDDEGYLYITGRIKEIINRGGEKISPREVEEALLEHSAVSQAVAFGVPHINLGEDIVAAVSLHQPDTATETELRHFLAKQLADFKVPRQIQILDDLPKSPSGKVQRSLLAKRVGTISESERHFRSKPSKQEAHGPLVQRVAEIWTEVLKLESVDSQDNFFELGGDSIRLTQVVSRLEQRLSTKIPFRLLFEYPTLAGFSERLRGRLLADQGTSSERLAE